MPCLPSPDLPHPDPRLVRIVCRPAIAKEVSAQLVATLRRDLIGPGLDDADLARERLLGPSARQAERVTTALESDRKVGGMRRRKPLPAV